MTSQERCNLECKARLNDALAARRALAQIGARHAATLLQEDTYFCVSTGRLKLRQTTTIPDRAELIFYDRKDDPAVRHSRYRLVAVVAPLELKSALSAALGVAASVFKQRELYLWENVRIHLDQVENLGNFIEFEAVLSSDADEAPSLQRLERLLELMDIHAEDRIACSYGDMMHQLQTPP